MQRKRIELNLEKIPHAFHPFAQGANAYDSSCSAAASVIYLDKEGGCFLKSAEKGSLAREAAMNRFFHTKGLGPEVLEYCSEERDWLLTRRVPGEDCIHAEYLADPKRLSETTGSLLRQLHELDHTGCPIPDHTALYFATAEKNYRAGAYDMHLFTEDWSFSSKEEAWQHFQQHRHLLKADTLLHGDYCLPNIILNDWQFSGFIDLDNGGVGDRHVDLFWGAWTLFFNLKTHEHRDRFFDAYGRDAFQPEMLRVIAAAECFG